MKFLTIMLLGVFMLGSLTACNVSARDGDTSISVSDDSRYKSTRDDGYYHCPPGHAKKGWC